MRKEVVALIAGILDSTLRKGHSVILHELLWTVDARLHLIISAEEVNEALQRVPPVRIERHNGKIELVPDVTRTHINTITAEDIAYASDFYSNHVSEIITRLSRRTPNSATK